MYTDEVNNILWMGHKDGKVSGFLLGPAAGSPINTRRIHQWQARVPPPPFPNPPPPCLHVHLPILVQGTPKKVAITTYPTGPCFTNKTPPSQSPPTACSASGMLFGSAAGSLHEYPPRCITGTPEHQNPPAPTHTHKQTAFPGSHAPTLSAQMVRLSVVVQSAPSVMLAVMLTSTCCQDVVLKCTDIRCWITWSDDRGKPIQSSRSVKIWVEPGFQPF